ncbi:CLUMA_CG004054, isoform A [Clunio marinus]|uniref:CLUMA_CG004054, isoform A n=1 Tax=Clunio marinus TaxID=568069 RepID=A0A1J1HV18_9DIPT|nr:CLUMA_CG004054, isoform A [Clunio marinus]
MLTQLNVALSRLLNIWNVPTDNKRNIKQILYNKTLGRKHQAPYALVSWCERMLKDNIKKEFLIQLTSFEAELRLSKQHHEGYKNLL